MAASRNDSYVLASDATFQNRVKESLIAAAVAIAGEPVGAGYAIYVARHKLASQILNGPGSYAALFASSVATDAAVLADATAAGTVVLTAGNVAAQAANVTDAHIDAAVSAQFNGFIAA